MSLSVMELRATMTFVDTELGAVVVVGGAGSIGRAVVEAYLDRGIRVIVIDRVSSAAGSSPRLRHVLADVTCDDDLLRARGEIDQTGWAIQHLVSLAGGATVAEFGHLGDTDAVGIRESIELNLTSHLLIIRTFLSHLGMDRPNNGQRDGDRSVVLMSSINALRDYGLPAYSAAKAGMFGLARALSTELGAAGIRINLVVPGTVDSGRPTEQPKDFDALREATALGRLAVPADIAAAVVALTHDLRAVTGQDLVVDCGQVVVSPRWRAPAGPSEVEQPAR